MRQQHAEPALPLARGTELANGRFIVERRLGEGGSGLVYAARDSARGNAVALKTLHLQEPAAVYNLKEEFRALRNIAHRNLVRLHELFLEEERCYFTMDLVEGVPFTEYVKGDEVRLRRALVQLTAAVAALHRAGKLHRDLKPSNVLIEASGRLVVLDFGLVLDEASLAHRTSDWMVGTPLYLAPELLQQLPPTPATDFYAIGVMLYEALANRPPFDGNPLTARLAGRKPLPPSSHVRGMAPELQQICMSLLEPDPDLRAGEQQLLEALGSDLPPAGVSASLPRAPGLVGRHQQLETLNRAFQSSAEQRQPFVTLVSGAAGMGKTAILERFAREHQSTAWVLSGSCHERESVPYKALDEVMDSLSRELFGLDENEVSSLVPADDAVHLVRLFPALGRLNALKPYVAQCLSSPSRDVRAQAYRALANVLKRLTEQRPVVMIIDDLQWGDLDSARLLLELFGAPNPPPLLLLVAFRSDERARSPCLAALLDGSRSLLDLLASSSMSIEGLDSKDAHSLARSLLQGIEQADAWIGSICAEANGSPLLLRELAAHVKTNRALRPRGVNLELGEVVGTRLERLSALAGRLFELVCVAGAPLSQSIAQNALASGDLSPAVIELEAERLLRDRIGLQPDAVDVYHDAIRQAAIARLDKERIRVCHLELARAHESVPECDPESVARHYAGALEQERASTWAERAAAQAMRALAFDRAANFYRMALDLGRGPEHRHSRLMRCLADALSDAGRGNEAAPLYLEIAKELPTSEALELQRLASEQWLVSGNVERGLAVLRALLAKVSIRLPQSPKLALVFLLASRVSLKLRGLSYEERNQGEIDPQELLRIDACRAALPLSFVSTVHGAAVQARFIGLALRAGEPHRIAIALGMQATYYSSEGAHASAEELRQRAEQLAARLNDAHTLAFLSLMNGQCRYLRGQWQTSVDALREAEACFLRLPRWATWELNSARFFWGNALAYLGQYREMRRRALNWLSDAENRGDDYARAGFRLIAARALAVCDDDTEGARAEIDRALSEWNSTELGVHRFLAEMLRIQINLYRGDPSAAWQLARDFTRRFRRSLMSRVQLCRIHVDHHVGYCELAMAATTDDPMRQRHLKQALVQRQHLLGEDLPWSRAFAQYLGATVNYLAWSRKDGTETPREILAELEVAVERLEGCDMLFYAAAARYRLGHLLGGTRGQACIARSESLFRAQGVLHPERLARMMAPGLPASGT